MNRDGFLYKQLWRCQDSQIDVALNNHPQRIDNIPIDAQRINVRYKSRPKYNRFSDLNALSIFNSKLLLDSMHKCFVNQISTHNFKQYNLWII